MKIYSRDIDSKKHWDISAKKYAEEMNNAYHLHRFSMIRKLYQDIDFVGKKCFDFGCGDGATVIEFLGRKADCIGIDISEKMIKLAKKSLKKNGHNGKRAEVGSVYDMAKFQSESFDVITSFNVLAYLNDEESDMFYRQAQRMLKKGGALIVTHSNELFDIYSLNSYTVEFFAKYFYEGDRDSIVKLLTGGAGPEIVTFNVRANPLNYKYELKNYGFLEVQQEFYNLHKRAPSLLPKVKDYPNTLNFSAEDKWKLLFMCSAFGSRSIKI